MEKKHRCRLCFRNFANGRALGGHMRSHMMKLYADEKRLKQEAEDEDEDEPFDDFQSVNSYSSTSSSDDDEEFEDSEEEEEVKLGDHEFSVVLQDGESETEDSKKKKKKSVSCRRSKRVRKSDFGRFSMEKRSRKIVQVAETEPLSSISETTPEEHVAHCLIMMSRDKWEREETEYQEEEDSEVVKVIKTKVRGKYRCEECNKLFRSYQALGGHRASHKKIKVTSAAAPPRAAAEEKIHQCPFCPRIFSSGQALGGHKRSHFIGGGAISTKLSTIKNEVKKETRKVETLNIDLNLPAPIEDDETSQIAVSAVSDAEFVNNLKE
ncbi:hypothetical protein ACS0TY_019619 [Phlomoides rotata]